MSWYHSTFLTIDGRPSNLLASCRRFSRRLSTGIFRAVRRIKTSEKRAPIDLVTGDLHDKSAIRNRSGIC